MGIHDVASSRLLDGDGLADSHQILQSPLRADRVRTCPARGCGTDNDQGEQASKMAVSDVRDFK